MLFGSTPHEREAPAEVVNEVDVSSRVTLGYIGGTSYCGSTLLSFLLNAQPEIASFGEVAWSIPKVNPGRFPCSCGATLETCGFWSKVNQAMQVRGYVFDAAHWGTAFDIAGILPIRKLVVRPLGNRFADNFRDSLVRRAPIWGNHLAAIGKRNDALIDSISAVTKRSVFVDASKDPARIRMLRNYSSLELHVIHLVRDAPAFVNSFVNKHRGSSIRKATRWWNATANRMENLRTEIPSNRWLQVRYEDLCVKPEVEIRRIREFLGVPGGTPIMDFRNTPNHIIGNSMRLGSSSEIVLDESWRDQLSKAQLADIRTSTMKNRQLLGYIDT